MNSTVLHRAKEVKVIQSGISQKVPYPSRNTDNISQLFKLSSAYFPMVMKEEVAEGK